MTDVSPGSASTGVEDRVLDAVLECSQRWGYERMTIDDVVERSGVSRATIYRLFPGGREVL
ncbi:MAG: helix-turn-helix domain-containing protein, partial [Ilumatobacteraceae bacterium]